MSAPLVALTPLRIEARAVAAGAPTARVVRIGMGPRRAATRSASLHHRDDDRDAGAKGIALAGVGGALVGGLAAGDVVVADRILAASGAVVATLPAAPLLAAEMHRAGLAVHVGAVVSTDRIVRGVAGRAALAATGAVAVDMESAAVLAQPWGRPTVVVRTVSDRPGQDLWSPATVTNGIRALRALRAAATVLERWAAAIDRREILLAAPRPRGAGVERGVVDDCELLLVVGSPTSSATRHLVEVAERAGREAEVVRDAGDLRLARLTDRHRVGVAAGTSTPDSLVQGVVDALDALGGVEVHHRIIRSENVLFSFPLEVR